MVYCFQLCPPLLGLFLCNLQADLCLKTLFTFNSGMRILQLLTAICSFFFLSGKTAAQNCIPTNINGAVINFACNQPCSDLSFQIPHIKSTDDYTVISIPYLPMPFVTLTGNEPTETYIDDQFSQLNNLPFQVCFYGSLFSNFVVGSNGIVSFDPSQANCKNDWRQDFTQGVGQAVPYVGTGTCSETNVRKYPPFSIMGPYQDLNPNITATSPDRKIEWRIEGTAPCRKLIISFFQVVLYGDHTKLNTSQMIIHESTGLVDIFIETKKLDGDPGNPWNSDFAILGLQKNVSKAITAPGKNCTVWSEDNTGYRFVPSAGTSRYVISRLYTMTGTLLATADTITTTSGLLDLSFPNVCFPAGSTNYEIRTTFSACDNPATQIISFDTITVNRLGTLNASATTTNTECGPPTGTITVTVPLGAGTSPFTYVLDGGAPVTGPSPHIFTNVSFGMHNIVITEAVSSCNSVLNVMVNRNNSLLASTTSTPTACAAANTGSITITPTNGTAPFAFQLDGFLPVSGAVPFTFSNVFGGNHNIIVTDATGCQTNVIVVDVPIGPGVSGNATSTIASCTTVANGSITATATAGIAPFTWQLDGGAAQTGLSPYTFLNVSSGAHTITITDNVGCSTPVNVSVVAGPGVLGNTSSTPASCQAVNNGTITATATLGVAPFTWQLDGGPFQSGANPYTFTNLSGGLHFVTIRDNVGCTRPFNVTVSSGFGPTASVVSGATSCNGAVNGTITVTPANGTAPYRFSLDGAPSVSGGIPFTFTNVSAGPHTIVVTDFPGCITGAISINVATGPMLTTTVSKTNVLCNGGATGTITVAQPALGTAPFQYSLDGATWQSSNSFTGLIAGSYTVFYRSGNGCQGSQPVSITQPATLTASTSSVPVVCNGENNGTIIISAGGGVSPYQFSINGGINWQSSSTFIVPAGNYTATIRDANNCITTRPVLVTQPAVLTASSMNINASCDGGNDGSIIVNTTGGNSSYAYSIDGVTFQTSNIFFVAPGTYSIIVRDNLGCRTSFSTTVGLTVNLFLTPLADPIICNGTSTRLNAVSNATIYSWSPAIGLNNTNIPNPDANPDRTTQYILTATLGRCTTEDTLILKVNKEPIPNAGPDGNICYGQSYTLQGTGGFQYIWTPAIYLNTPSGANPIATPSKTTTYTLSVIDSIGCRSLITDDVKVVTSRPMRINTSPFDTTAHPGDEFQLLATSTGISYTWSPVGGLSNPNIANPVVKVGNIIGDEIMYQVVGVTAEGCKGEGYVKIRVYKGPDIYVPTGFTPNNDGNNDKFTPFPVGIKSYNYFRVFNRWGQLIFFTTRQHDGWDGKIAGKEQPTGVYVWMIEGISTDNKVITKKGTITLIR